MEKNYAHHPFRMPDRRGHKVLKIVGWTFGGILLAAVFALVFGLVVKALWNWLMPAVFGLGTITYWQAFGLVILAKLLFSSFHPHHKDHSSPFHKRFHDRWKEHEGKKQDNDWMMEGWKHYKQYWKERGRLDFEDYLKKEKEEKTEPGQD